MSIEKPQGEPRQPPKTDTLVTLLVQGLQSEDRKLLNVSYTYQFVNRNFTVTMMFDHL